jgi:FkbM family methyltransferase
MDPYTWQRSSQSFFDAGQLELAEAAIRRAIEIGPDNAGFQNQLSHISSRLGKLDAAVEASQRASALDPKNPHLLRRLSQLLASEGRLDDAEVAIREAIEIEPGNAEFQHSLSQVLELQGKLEDALAALQLAVELDKTRWDLRLHFAGRLLESNKRLDEAETALAEALPLAPEQAMVLQALDRVRWRREAQLSRTVTRSILGCNETRGAKTAYHGLVMDLGVSEGNDTAYYLAKGFKVIAVEADPVACERLHTRFAPQIGAGALRLFNFAASDTFGTAVDIFIHQTNQGVSGLTKHLHLADGYIRKSVMTINWRALLAQEGNPRYLKIDIEGQEEAFLRGMLQSRKMPEFISVECHTMNAAELLDLLGYHRFKLVDQNPPGGFQLPTIQMEGNRVEDFEFINSSGPFGLDIFNDGAWLDFGAFQRAWQESRSETHRTWFDCHAWKPN